MGTLQDAPDPEPAERTRLQAALAHFGGPLLRAREMGGVRAWLGGAAASDEGTHELVGRLADHVESPQFLERLTASCAARETAGPEADGACPEDVTKEDFWRWDETTGTFTEVDGAQAEQEAIPPTTSASLGESFVVVEHEDVVEAIANFIAHFVASHPQALHMPPEKLQKAVSAALRDMRKSRARKVVSAGKALYRWAVWSYGAFRLYENPWVVRAVSLAFWASLRLVLGMVF